MNIEAFVDDLTERALSADEEETPALEDVLRGKAVELWSDTAGRLFIVANEADARRLMAESDARRGEVYTADEVRRICSISDRDTVHEVHAWKRRFDGRLRDEHRSS